MPNLWTVLRGRSEERLSIDDYANFFKFNGSKYALIGGSSPNDEAEYDSDFLCNVQSAYKASGPVFACLVTRLLVFAEARFQWQRLVGGRPGELFGTPELELLERPWPNGTTGDLLGRMEQDGSLAGNFFVVREAARPGRPERLRRLRPDWVDIVLTAPPAEAVQSDIAGYAYRPGGTGNRVLYLPHEVGHYAPIPDPESQYRGMSWLTPLYNEVAADKAATLHKRNFFRNGATPQLAVSLKETVTEEQFKKFIRATNEASEGVDNAYKTLYLGGGADVTVVGQNLRQLDFKLTQGAGETRISAAAGVPAVIVGLSEGLQAATYSNYAQARRRMADGTTRPNWRSACGALEPLMNRPAASRLWYDDRDIAFLREDAKDSAEIEATRAKTIAALVQAGYEADAVVDAVMAQDLSRLAGKHTGLFSVQLQPPTPDQSKDTNSD